MTSRFPVWLLVLLTFFGSGLLHIYPLYCAGLSIEPLLVHFSFFVVQGIAVLIEGKYFPKSHNQYFTYLFLILTCPLFILPVTNHKWFWIYLFIFSFSDPPFLAILHYFSVVIFLAIFVFLGIFSGNFFYGSIFVIARKLRGTLHHLQLWKNGLLT